MVTSGSRGRHFDNPIWPGAVGAIFTVTSPAQVPSGVPPETIPTGSAWTTPRGVVQRPDCSDNVLAERQ